MHLSLIGMSGIGKSHWSARLAEQGFLRVGCDDLIANRLGFVTSEEMDAVQVLGEWAGLPNDPNYQSLIDQYLVHEIEVMNEVLAELERLPAGAKIVIDTTGSVIYTGRDILTRLYAQTRLIYLKATADIHAQLLQAQLATPRPLVWQGLFQQAADESLEQAFQRSYTKLLNFREQQYQQWCHLSLAYEEHHRPGLTVTDFLQMITSGDNHV